LRVRNVLCLLASVLTLVSAGPAPAAIQFEDATGPAGVSYTGRSWGSMWGDFDGDGAPDVWVVNHQNPASLFRNQGDGTFVDIYPAVTDSAFQSSYDTHGAAWADFDNDGDMDIYQLADEGTGGPVPNRFFRNDGGQLTEVATALGLEYTIGRGRMPLWLDYDGDARLDVMHPTHRRDDGTDGPTAMFHQDSTGVFTDMAGTVGLVPNVTKSSNFELLADLSGDGVPELLTHLSRFPENVFDMGTVPFVDVKASLGVPTRCCVLDATAADLDGDLDVDLYLVHGEKYMEFVQVDANTLEVHLQGGSALPPFDTETGIAFQSSGDVTIDPYPFWVPTDVFIGSGGIHPTEFPFTVIADSSALGVFAHTPAVDEGLYVSYDPGTQTWQILRSGDQANLVIESAAAISGVTPINWSTSDPAREDELLRNTGNGFVISTVAAGITVPSEGRNVVAGDFDNDMDLDLYIVCTGPVQNIPNKLYENTGGGNFILVAGAGGAAGSTDGRGDAVTTADYDGDGFLDLLVTNGVSKAPWDEDGPTHLFHNLGNANHWLEIDLVGGPASARDAIGARVLATAGGVTQVRDQTGGIHYRAQNHQRLHFGLGANTQVDTLVVTWPSGVEHTLHDVAADQILLIAESSATAAPAPAEAASTVRLTGCYPNPFRPSTTIAFSLPRALPVTVSVHDAGGRLVKRVVNGRVFPAGPGAVVWAGRDGTGRRVASGVYFVRLEAGSTRITSKVVLLQ
jgi:hypothetical protein